MSSASSTGTSPLMGQPKLVSAQPKTSWPVSMARFAICSSAALFSWSDMPTLALLCASLALMTKAISSTP